MTAKQHNKINQSILAVIIFCGISLATFPNKTEAWWGITGDPVFEIGENLYTNIATTESTIAEEVKEYILDGLAWGFANSLIEHIADSTVDWINSGFKGSPAFITNFDDTLTDVADQTLGEFIEGSSLAFLCSPFSLDIKIALTLQFGGERRAHCTLSDVFENADDALDDLGNDWSWDKWYNVTQPQNNVYGAYTKAYADLTLKLAEAEDKTITKSKWAGGFLEYKHCEDDKEVTECETVTEEGRCETYTVPGKCTTQTPGTTINNSLTKVLGLGNDRLTAADELDEIIAALLNQLVSSVFNSNGGLLKSNPGGSNNQNFSKISSSQVEAYEETLTDALTLEEEYKSWKQLSLDMVDSAEEYLLALIECLKTYRGTEFTPAEVQAKITAAENEITNTLKPLQEELTADINQADENIEKIKALLKKIDDAKDEDGKVDAKTMLDTYNDFQELELHGKIAVVEAELEYEGPDGSGIKLQMNTLIKQAVTDTNTCKKGSSGV